MSIVLQKMFEKRFRGGYDRSGERGEPVFCALCRGELYPGDVYFRTDRGRVCEACLERYARDYFSPDCRRLGREGDAP